MMWKTANGGRRTLKNLEDLEKKSVQFLVVWKMFFEKSWKMTTGRERRTKEDSRRVTYYSKIAANLTPEAKDEEKLILEGQESLDTRWIGRKEDQGRLQAPNIYFRD